MSTRAVAAHHSTRHHVAAAVALALALTGGACERERRRFEGTPSDVVGHGVQRTKLAAGQPLLDGGPDFADAGAASVDAGMHDATSVPGRGGALPAGRTDVAGGGVAGGDERTKGVPREQRNAYAIAEGQRLFVWMNCNGCHGQGGGGMGPPLMDRAWRYGSEPDEVYASIVEGRPNGMPAFRGKLTEQQAWQLVAFVRSLGGLVPLDAAPGRADNLAPTVPVLDDQLGPERTHAEVPPR